MFLSHSVIATLSRRLLRNATRPRDDGELSMTERSDDSGRCIPTEYFARKGDSLKVS